MSWNGSGTFNRLYSWVADKAAGLDISSVRMDADTNDIASQGFGNCLTRDGQGQPTANLPMNNFKHTGLASGAARTESVNLGQVQDGQLNWTIAGGSADAITATYTPAITALTDGQLCYFRAASANLTTAPTFSPNGLTAHAITRFGGGALGVNDIEAGGEYLFRYNSSGTRWEMMNPSYAALLSGVPTTGDVKMTVKTSADSGWLLFDDGTFGSATSGSSNSNSALNQALFTLMFNNVSDSAAPILTSAGAGTTRAGQGTAAAAWAANCRMTLPRTLGRALGVAGAGSGLTSRALGVSLGSETQTLITNNLPPYTPTGSISGVASSVETTVQRNASNITPATGGSTSVGVSNPGVVTVNGNQYTFTGGAQGGSSSAFSIMQPATFFNAMIKQ